VLSALVRSGKPASELLHVFDPVPQLLKNVVYADGDPLADFDVKKAIADGERALEGRGRLVIRKSGTEPKIRVMAEGDSAAEIERVIDSICEAVANAAGECRPA
jgi:phosphoglucosamine mutase